MQCMLGIFPSLPNLPCPSPYPLNFLSFFLFNTLGSICHAQVLLDVLSAFECVLPARGQTLKDNLPSHHRQLSVANSCSSRDGSLYLTSLLHTGILSLCRLHVFSVCCQNHREVTCATAVWCLEKIVLW